MDTLKDIYIYTLKELLMYIKTRTCKVYKHNEHVMYILQWTRNVYNKILFIEYTHNKNNVM